jgi:hypothetical protein
MFDTSFDKELSKLDIYNRFPQLKPAIGKHYRSRKNKILIVAESHYFPKESTIHENSDIWYSSSFDKLKDIEKNWTNTRLVLEEWRDPNNKNPKAYLIFDNLQKAASEFLDDSNKSECIFEHLAFMNYFLRPAKTGLSLKRDHQDKEISYNNIYNVSKLLGINHILFVSRMAYRDFMWFQQKFQQIENLSAFSIPHPSSSWWNRKSKNYLSSNNEVVTGKNLYRDILRRLNAFK